MLELPKPHHFESVEVREWLISMLKQQEVTISFTKLDGTTRVLIGTLNPSVCMTPEIDLSLESFPVYDTELTQWRTIRWVSIIHLKADL